MSRSWREAVLPLKQAGRTGPATSQLAAGCLEALSEVSAYSLDVRGEDAINDLVQLAQALSRPSAGTAVSKDREAATAVTCCQLLTDLLQHRKVAMPAVAMSAISPILRSWADEASPAHVGVHIPHALQTEAMKALAAVVHERAAQLSETERAAVLALLVSLVPQRAASTQPASPSWRSPAQRDREQKPVFDERSRLAVQALGGLCTHAGAWIPLADLRSAATAVMAALEAFCGVRQPLVEGVAAGRFYSTLLRTLSVLLFEDHGLNVASFTEAMRKFFTYGAAQHPAASRPGSGRLGATASPLQPPFATAGLSAGSNPASPRKGGSAQPRQAAGQAAAPASGLGSAPGSPAKASGAGGAYLPPHLRGKQAANGALPPVPASGHRVRGWSEDADGGGSSESESDNEGALGTGDRFKSSRVRLAALNCLQVLVKADCKALHPHWTSLLPVHTPLATRAASATLVDVVVNDPLVKVRAAAAGAIAVLLEGAPQRAYLAIAEAKPNSRQPVRGFTTLSASLGQMTIALHDGLFHAIATEGHHVALTATLRALCTLLGAAPYPRLPADLLPRAVDAVRRCLGNLTMPSVSSAADLATFQAAAVACLAAALNTKAPSAALAQRLADEAAQARPQHAGPSAAQDAGQRLANGNAPTRRIELQSPHATATSTDTSLACQLLELAETGPVLVRLEALGTLRGLATNYPGLLCARWGALSRLADHALQATISSPRVRAGAASTAVGLEERLAQQGVRLLGDFLASASGAAMSAGADDEAAGPGPAGSTQHSTAHSPSKVGTAAGGLDETDGAPAGMAVMSPADLAGLWTDAWTALLPQALVHPSPAVRAAAHTVTTALTEPVFQALSPAIQQQVLRETRGSLSQEAAAPVRAAAAKALGVLVSFPCLLSDADGCAETTTCLVAAVRETSVSVRIMAAWALANLANAMLDMHQCQLSLPAGASMQVEPIARASLAAAQDSDKVRANGVRSLGNLLAFVDVDSCRGGGNQQAPQAAASNTLSASSWTAQHGSTASDARTAGSRSEPSCITGSWLEAVLQCLQSTLTTGNVKVQWNACYALGNLLRNASVSAAAAVCGRLPSLLLLLLMMVRDNAYYKIRMHAAAALMGLRDRGHCGETYTDAIRILCCALENMEGVGADVATKPPAGASAPGGMDFKYRASLKTQLRASLLHLLAFAQPADRPALQDFVAKHAAFLQAQLALPSAHAGLGHAEQAEHPSSIASDAQVDHQRAAPGDCAHLSSLGVPGGAAGTAGKAGCHRKLPSDPFSQRQCQEALAGQPGSGHSSPSNGQLIETTSSAECKQQGHPDRGRQAELAHGQAPETASSNAQSNMGSSAEDRDGVVGSVDAGLLASLHGLQLLCKPESQLNRDLVRLLGSLEQT